MTQEVSPVPVDPPLKPWYQSAGAQVPLSLMVLAILIAFYWWYTHRAEGIVSLPRLDGAAAERLQIERIEKASLGLQADIDALRKAPADSVAVCPPGTSRMSAPGKLLLPEGGAVGPGAGPAAPDGTGALGSGDGGSGNHAPASDTPGATGSAGDSGPSGQSGGHSASGATGGPTADTTPGPHGATGTDGAAAPDGANAPNAKIDPATQPTDHGARPPASGTLATLSNNALADKLERATAIVVTSKGTGTGFFINDTLMVTNRHVVDSAEGNEVEIASRTLGVKRHGTVLRKTVDAKVGDADFALIRLDDGKSPGFLDLSTRAEKLNPIVAAGYPALAINDDPDFRRLLRGDGTAAPDLNVTQGIVQSLRKEGGGMAMVLHTATILPGNSGGPLVDACGRVIGINTYFTQDAQKFGKLSYAQGTAALMTFLQAAGGQTRDDERECG